jgi:hypothetical protein
MVSVTLRAEEEEVTEVIKAVTPLQRALPEMAVQIIMPPQLERL